MGVVTPLYGHTSEETAYVVADQSWGTRLRCQARHWLEYKSKHGWRYVSQTSNPTKPGLYWSKPQRSTYVRIAANLYLNQDGQVGWRGITEVSTASEVRAFLADFPETDLPLLVTFTQARSVWLQNYTLGTVYFAINGEKRERTEAEKAEDQRKYEDWHNLMEYVRELHRNRLRAKASVESSCAS